jgi:ubiquinone/menaquinone biosynthesis C-methylase UbiE
MKHPSKIRRSLKHAVHQIIGMELTDKLRNIYNLKDIYTYNRYLEKKVRQLILQRKGISVKGDISLLTELHKLFPTIDLSDNYKLNNLLNVARNRYKYLSSCKIPLSDKDVIDFGAGHGENLMMIKEFNFKSCTGYDFSDKSFMKHKDKIPPGIYESIKFKTLDLVTDDIGANNSDIILSFSAFEHFDDPDAVLDKCYRALRKGGYLYAEFAAFNAAFATHRKIFSGVPHIQNIFNDEVAYEFFYRILRINDQVNRYTNKKITNGNP